MINSHQCPYNESDIKYHAYLCRFSYDKYLQLFFDDSRMLPYVEQLINEEEYDEYFLKLDQWFGEIDREFVRWLKGENNEG